VTKNCKANVREEVGQVVSQSEEVSEVRSELTFLLDSDLTKQISYAVEIAMHTPLAHVFISFLPLLRLVIYRGRRWPIALYSV